MARLRILPAILLIWGCSKPPTPPVTPIPTVIPVPAKLPPVVWVKPGRYASKSEPSKSWMLVPGHSLMPFLSDLNFHVTRAVVRWSTLYQGIEPRYVFEERLDGFKGFSVNIYVSSKDTSLQVAQIPLPTTPGKTWESRSGSDGLPDQGSCRLEDGALRVDFKKGEELRHSLWFTQEEGLVRWKGIEGADLERLSGNAEDPELWLAAMRYESYGRVDDDLRWAPTMCRGPQDPPLRMSASTDSTTHGRKMYYLFAKDRLAYLRSGEIDQPDGQVVVKESWLPGRQKEKGPLFLMMKSRGEWIYATASPDGGTLTSSGKITSCVKCHEDPSTHDRMFGLRPAH